MPDPTQVASSEHHDLAFDPDIEMALLEQAEKLRREAWRLKEAVSQGHYDGDQLRRFWSIVHRSGRELEQSPRALSERSGLGPNFFSEVVRDRRSPKLSNMLRALSGIISAATARLGTDYWEAPDERPAWVQNPLLANPAATEIQQQLIELIGHIKAKNSFSEIKEIDQYWRSSLIELLETTLAILKAPMVEKSLIGRTCSALKRLSFKLAGDGATSFLGELARSTASNLAKHLLGHIV